MNGRGKECLDPFAVEMYLPSHFVGNKDELHWPFGRFEFHRRLVRLFVSGHKAHVSTRDADKSGHVGVASNSSRGPRRVVPYWENHDGEKWSVCVF